MEVKRVPEFKQEGAAGAYYEQPSMDGSRGGIFYANLRDVTETVKFGMKTLAYHEGIPGHHFQIAIQGELKNVPIFRGFPLFTAYTEGWALYAEQLAWELGFYENDPKINLAQLDLFSPWYAKEYQFYKINASKTEEIKPLLKDISFVLLMGTWCEDSQREVSGMLKILEAAGYPINSIEIRSIYENFTMWS